MDREKIKNLLEVGEKSADEIRADVAAALIEIDSGMSEIEKLTNDIAENQKEIDRLKESNIRLYNMVTVPVRNSGTPMPEKSHDEKTNDLISRYMK